MAVTSPGAWPFGVARRLVAEALGTGLLAAIVIGSGIMGAGLAGGNVAVALLANSAATGAGLVVLVTLFGPVSGAHFNPAVTLVFALRRALGVRMALCYLAAQLVGAVIGVWTAHLMFGEPVLQVSLRLRDGPAQALSEGVAAFGLIATILGAQRFAADRTAAMVGLYIASAYWFTASTSFANPALTVARAFSAGFAGIAPASVPAFVAAQIGGAIVAAAVCGWLFREERIA